MRHAIVAFGAHVFLPLGLPFVALLLNLALMPLLTHETPFLLFIAAVLFCAWFDGTRAGFLASLTSMVAATAFFEIVDASQVRPIGQVVRLIMLLAEGFLISAIIGMLQTRVARDAAEHDAHQEALGASEARFAGIVNAAMDAIICVDATQRVIVFNPAAERLFGYAAADMLGQPLDCLIPPTQRQAHAKHLAAFQHTGVSTRTMGIAGRVTGLHADGTPLALEASIAQLALSGQPVFIAFLRDISARLAAEQAVHAAHAELEQRVAERTRELTIANAQLSEQSAALATREALLRRMGEMARVGGWELDIEAQIVRWSEEVYRIHEVPIGQEPDLDSAISFYAPEARPIIQQAIETAIRDGTPWDVELPFVTARGRSLWVRAQGEAEYAEGRIIRLHGTFQDITVRKEAELRLRTSLAERETLLKEVHHRVKNNLQVVMSLLRLQSRSVADPVAAQALRESRQRVEVMALVHELLYRAGDLASINAGAYVRQLSAQLAQIYTSSLGQVALSVQADDLWLSLDQAVPCGLIINELVSNSLKYAFPAGKPGQIGLVLQKSTDDTLTLRVWDTGVGLPPQGERIRPALGMQLVHDLTRQLRGTIVIDGSAGTSVTITFPIQAI